LCGDFEEEEKEKRMTKNKKIEKKENSNQLKYSETNEERLEAAES
jgi:hypothetical protein